MEDSGSSSGTALRACQVLYQVPGIVYRVRSHRYGLTVHGPMPTAKGITFERVEVCLAYVSEGIRQLCG